MSELLAIRLIRDGQPVSFTVEGPWPLPDIWEREGERYVKVAESQLSEFVPGIARGAQYEWAGGCCD